MSEKISSVPTDADGGSKKMSFADWSKVVSECSEALEKCEAEQVAAFEKGGDRLGLNGSGVHIVLDRESAAERLGNAEIRKSRIRHVLIIFQVNAVRPATVAGALTRGLAAFQRAWNREGVELFWNQAVPKGSAKRAYENN